MAVEQEAKRHAEACAFVERWQQQPGHEDEQARSFWIELLGVLGVAEPTRLLEFERKVKGRKIDVFYEDMGVLVEMKSRGVSLDKPEMRSKKTGVETPYEQAKWYADNLPYSIRPRWVLTCNFDELRVYDLDEFEPQACYISLELDEVPDQLGLLDELFTKRANSRLVKEQELSVAAGAIVGRLYDAFAVQYAHLSTDEHEQRSLNVLIVRLVFLLYAEDAGLLHHHQQFHEYLAAFPEGKERRALIDLFRVLDTPESQRDPNEDPDLLAFPYVNGGLFTDESIIIPQFTPEIRVALLTEASAKFNWSSISPTIFGAVFESTLNPETRRAGGMHYTSVENIHNVIDPLFYDALKAELADIEGKNVSQVKRKAELRAFQRKLASMNFLDPAAGSFNFLTETYVCLRKLELRVIEDLVSADAQVEGQATLGTGGSIEDPIMVSIAQMHGIEINDFAVSVGKTALWIAEQQMLSQTLERLPGHSFEFLPLKSITHAVCGNALRMDWNDVLPAAACSYVIGNPPFVGARMMSKQQKAEVTDAFAGARGCGSADYVAAWYAKAADYMASAANAGGAAPRCAFVSTNSLCQGDQVACVWKPLHEQGVTIDFAHDTFRWRNEASEQAHVFVIIVGFSLGERGQRECMLFHHANPDAPAVQQSCAHLNAYLHDAPDVLVANRSKPLCACPKMGIGSQPIDNGNFIFKPDEMETFLKKEPAAAPYFHRFMGSDELIKGHERYVLWLGELEATQLREMPMCNERVKAVRAYRMASTRVQTQKAAKTPNHFGTEIIADSTSIIVPRVSSERRRYAPMGFVGPETFCSDAALLIPNASLYHFGVLHSLAHNAWMRVVCGRLKSDYRYSAGIVYNNFPWPGATRENLATPVEKLVPAAMRSAIESCAHAVLDARELYADATLAQLYDPDNAWMYPELTAAHRELDEAVEHAYGLESGSDEDAIVAHLMRRYAELTAE